MTKQALLAIACFMLGQSMPVLASENNAMTLPPTRLDSFVHHALITGHAEHIYGDEGVFGPPPYTGFNIKHRINIGICGKRDEGLTTGHGDYMPDAWGSDEFLRPPGAWSRSGANYGDHQYNGVDGNDYSPVNEGSSWEDTAGGDNYNSNGSPNGGNQQQVKLPYQIGPDWIGVRNTHNGQVMGYMAPGESFEDFFSGRSGHLLPGWEAEGKYILENQLPQLRGRK